MRLNGFNAGEVEPMRSFEPLPAGLYLAVIVDSEESPTKSGNGHFLKLTFEVQDGKHKGRKVYTRLNLDNPSQQAVQLAQAELSAICRAIGILTPQDSSDLHNMPLTVNVRLAKGMNGEPQNSIKEYLPKAAYSGEQSQGAQPQQRPASAGNTAPWMR